MAKNEKKNENKKDIETIQLKLDFMKKNEFYKMLNQLSKEAKQHTEQIIPMKDL